MAARDLLLLDFETTGLLPDYHEPVEIGCIIVDWKTLEIKSQFRSDIRPMAPDRISPKAFEVNGRKYEGDLEHAPMPDDVLDQWLEWVKPFGQLDLTGYGVHFDRGFLETWHRRCGKDLLQDYGYGMWDIKSMVQGYYRLSKESEDRISLALVAPKMGIPHEAAHTAMSDVMATYHIIRRFKHDLFQ